MDRYIVMVSSASVSAARRKWGGQYRNVAVVEIETTTPAALTKRILGEDMRPALISDRARGVVRVVRRWPGCRVGTTARSQFAVAKTEADALAARLNAED